MPGRWTGCWREACALADRFEEYITTVQAQVRWKRARNGLEDELRTHLMDQRDACMEEGLDGEEAAAESVRLMGDPVEVGTRLDRVHRPKPQWGLLALVGIILTVGFQLQYLTWEIAGLEPSIAQDNYFQLRWGVSVCIGAAVMLAVYFLDYTLLGKRPVLCWSGGALLLVIVYCRSAYFNGARFNIKYWMLLAPVLLAVLVYGMRGKGWRGYVLCLAGIGAFTLLGMHIPSSTCTVTVCSAGMTLLLLAVWKGWMGVPRRQRITAAVLLLLSGLFLLLLCLIRYPHMLQRLSIALHPDLERGYASIATRSMLRGAKWIGEGSCDWMELLPSDQSGSAARLLPNAPTDQFLTWIIYKLGWLAGLAVMGLLAVMLAWMFRKACKQRGMLGFLVSMAAVLTLGMETAAYAAFNLGFQMFGPLSLPLISYGGRFMVVHMALVGLTLSVFREERLPLKERAQAKGRNLAAEPWVMWQSGDLVIRTSRWKKLKRQKTSAAR